ncbi:MAG: hypothetical protein LBS54_02565 [Dysgonamonadaceae bacterium]|jgi:hypothetical protein|nr:hypothetical protein [Dysgonamonadaceae bacterium]
MNQTLTAAKRLLPHLIAVAAFALLAVLYFKPAYEGKTLQQSDVLQWKGMVKELHDYGAKNPGARSAWSGTMFSGMPAYNFGTLGGSSDYTYYIKRLFHLGDSEGAGPIFAGLVCAYILFFLLTGNFWVSLIGAIGCGFTSYNLVILQAGHVTKAWAIAFMPLTLAGILLVFRKRFLQGGALFALALTLELGANHIQITYYLTIACFVIYLAWLAKSLRNKEYNALTKGTLVLTVALIIAVLPRIPEMYSNLEMSHTSLRGPSELTQAFGNSDAKPSSGLDRDYAFTWSYGKGETLSLLIPNIRGGESGGTLDKDSHLVKALKDYGQRTGKEVQSYTYWGDKPFTSGPVYAGAVICFLFVLGMFVIRSNGKWWLFGIAVLFVLLSWGRNLAWFNDFLFHHLPMYNKFRTPEMSLVITALILPIIAGWGLKSLLKGEFVAGKLKKQFLYSLGITGGICLLLWVMPAVFLNFESEYDRQFVSQVPEWYYTALISDREAMLKSDAFRSLVFILLAAVAVLFIAGKNRKHAGYAMFFLTALTLIDLWSVDKRYLNESNFEKKKPEQTFEPSAADKVILEDKTLSYRVLNLSVNTFNDASTSYFHKSIGGYSAAKLRRYQELVDAYITSEIQVINQTFQPATTINDLDSLTESLFVRTPIINMLNGKYIIYRGVPVENHDAFGNVWFVSDLKTVDNADAELAALGEIDLRTTAVVDKRFESLLRTTTPSSNISTPLIKMTEYRPERQTYTSQTSTEQLAVFSEVYYTPGWKAFIDGQPAPHFRVNWILRAMYIPAGEHKIEFLFEPDTYNMLTDVASWASLLVIILVIGAVILSLRRKNN